jgi:hypothetical protein
MLFVETFGKSKDERSTLVRRESESFGGDGIG